MRDVTDVDDTRTGPIVRKLSLPMSPCRSSAGANVSGNYLALAAGGEQRLMTQQTSKRHTYGQRSIQRWENEGGATEGWPAKRPSIPSRLENQDKAATLAGQAIDRRADFSATSEERKARKRRLLKGPKEFRSMRRDRRK
jgi:hypothetical protein